MTDEEFAAIEAAFEKRRLCPHDKMYCPEGGAGWDCPDCGECFTPGEAVIIRLKRTNTALTSRTDELERVLASAKTYEAAFTEMRMWANLTERGYGAAQDRSTDAREHLFGIVRAIPGAIEKKEGPS